MIRLEDVLTDEEIYGVAKNKPNFPEQVRACIALAVERAEKVSGFVSTTRATGLVHDGHAAGWFFIDPKDVAGNGAFRHALLLLGPKYEPKPVKSAEERSREALAMWESRQNMTFEELLQHADECFRILRGEEGR